MSTYFVDLDGTFFRFGTQDPLPGAAEEIKRLEAEGHTIIWTTLRFMGDQKFGYAPTISRFRELGIKSETVIWECPSPRIVVNDDGAVAINVERNGSVRYGSLS